MIKSNPIDSLIILKVPVELQYVSYRPCIDRKGEEITHIN